MTLATPTPAPVAPTTRDPWLDNAKMALVTLVVVGHAWTLLPATALDDHLDDHLYDFLYAWHVPAFVFVTGYLSRSFAYTRTRMWQLFCTVVVPYAVFECALALFRIHVGGERLEDLFADPHWPMWYLAALFFWRLLTPPFKALRGGLVLAVVISLAAGLWAGDTLDIARVMGLLPFFVMGLKTTPELLERLRAPGCGWRPSRPSRRSRCWRPGPTRWPARSGSTTRSLYRDLDVSDARAVLTRTVLLVVGALGAWAFLALVPRVGGWFTRMGAWTLVVYLFHGFAVKGLQYAGFSGWAAEHAVLSLVLTTAGAVALALLLAWEPVAHRLNHLVDPLGYAQRKVEHAVELTAATAHADAITDALDTAIEERGPAPAERPGPAEGGYARPMPDHPHPQPRMTP